MSWKGSLTTVSAGTLSLQGWDPGHLRDISVPALAVCSKDACRPGSLSFAGHRTSLVVPSLEQPSAVPENCGEDGQSFPCLVLGSSDVSAALLVGESTSFSTTHGRCRAVAACPVLSLARMMFLFWPSVCSKRLQSFASSLSRPSTRPSTRRFCVLDQLVFCVTDLAALRSKYL